MNVLGTLVGLNDILTRKRYAKSVNSRGRMSVSVNK